MMSYVILQHGNQTKNNGGALITACLQNGRFDDAVEDIELRLEEFEHLLEMQQRDAATCLFKQMPQLSRKFEEMERVFDSIDRLELMVARYEVKKYVVLLAASPRTSTYFARLSIC